MPRTVFWFRLYCTVLCLFYLLLTAAGVSLLILPPGTIGTDPMTARLIGAVVIVLGLFYCAATFLGLHMPRRPGAWTYCFALILLGFTSVIFLPFGVFLMTRWQRPEIRAYYHANPP